MLLEGALAVLVILACCAGLGMGVAGDDGTTLVGREAWLTRYDPTGDWGAFGLGPKVSAFVDGGANFLTALAIPQELALGIIAVLVACFAATTLDTATRLQRYVIQELAGTFRVTPMTNKYAATGLAVGLGLMVALIPAKPGAAVGTGGLILWPLFGATNQLLAGLAFMVTVFYLWRRNKPIWFAAIPMIIMVIMPAWALIWQMFNAGTGWFWPLAAMARGEAAWAWSNTHLLFAVGLTTFGLQIWMVIEALAIFAKAKGVLEQGLPPLPDHPPRAVSGVGADARSC